MIHAHSTVKAGSEGAVKPDFHRQAKAIEDHLIAGIDRERATKLVAQCPIYSRIQVPLKAAA